MSDGSSAGFGGDQPPANENDETATAKFGGPIEDEATALQKLEKLRIDPDQLEDKYDFTRIGQGSLELYTDGRLTWKHTPMEYFCRVGNLKMCRFLLSKGVATTSQEDEWSPMLAAARGGHLDVCKWLCQFGARNDLNAITGRDDETLLMRVCRWDFTSGHSVLHGNDSRYFGIGKWLILEGVLSDGFSGLLGEALSDGFSGRLSRRLLRRDFGPRAASGYNTGLSNVDPRPAYSSWADGVLADHRSFVAFLNGAHTRSPPYSEGALRILFSERLGNASLASIAIDGMTEDGRRRTWDELVFSPVQTLAGSTGVLKSIADYVGVARGRDLRIIRWLAKELRLFLEEVPVARDVPDDETDDSEEISADFGYGSLFWDNVYASRRGTAT